MTHCCSHRRLRAVQRTYLLAPERRVLPQVDIPFIFVRRFPVRTLSKVLAVLTVPGWIAMHSIPAAAQNFDDRWSIIPKAHADPAPPVQEQDTTPQAAPPSADNPTSRTGDHQEPEQARRNFTGKASFYSYR